MESQARKKCSTLLDNKEMKFKRWWNIPIRKVQIINTGGEEKQESLNIAGGMWNSSHSEKKFDSFSESQTYIYLTVNLNPRYLSKRKLSPHKDLYMNVQSSFNHDS